jgi:hypothetical protein
VNVRRLTACLALLALAGCGATHTAAPSPLPEDVPPFPFVQLLRGARSMGDPMPTSAVWTTSRRARAVAVTMGDSVRADGRVYVAVLHGHFKDELASRPAGADAPSGTVETVVIAARSGMIRDFGLGNRAVSLGRLGTVHDFLPYLRLAAAKDRASSLETQWLEAVSAGERTGCRVRFPNLPRAVFRPRLRAAAARAGATVISVRFLHACQDAPVVVLRSSNRRRLAHALARILTAVDPPRNGARLYEGSFFVLVDGHGKPFVVTYDEYRGQPVGSQWAATPDLYPFPHG